MPKKSKPKRTAIYALLPDETVKYINDYAERNKITQWCAIDNLIGCFDGTTPLSRQLPIIQSLRK